MLANETVQVTYNLMLSFSAMYGPELKITYTRINYPDVYEKVPVMPDFPEGQQALMEFLAKKIQYPNTGTEGNGVQGRTIIPVSYTHIDVSKRQAYAETITE